MSSTRTSQRLACRFAPRRCRRGDSRCAIVAQSTRCKRLRTHSSAATRGKHASRVGVRCSQCKCPLPPMRMRVLRCVRVTEYKHKVEHRYSLGRRSIKINIAQNQKRSNKKKCLIGFKTSIAGLPLSTHNQSTFNDYFIPRHLYVYEHHDESNV
jgi:hypothetical protein